MRRIELIRQLWAGVAAVALALGPGTGPAAADSETDREAALEVVETLHAALVDAASAGLSLDERFAELLPVVRATHDLPYIAELTIRRQWQEIDAEQRQAFTEAFERLSAMTYAARFGAATADTFEIAGSEAVAGGRIQVRASIVRPDADDISMDYLLHQRKGSWRIVNILADGVSDLALKRAEYQRILGDGSIEDLIDHLEDEAAKLR
jgi:phospholipid transport system substrate-binding protein